MHHSFQEGSEAEDEGHEHIGGGEAIHVGEEVAGVLAVLVVVAQVAAEGDQNNDQHEEGGADLEDSGSKGVAEENLEGSEAEEGEIFQVALDEELDEDESEGVGPEVLADLVLEEAVEDPVVEELEQDYERDGEDEKVQQIVQEEVVVP